jgi:hypothetical protein
MLKWHISHSYYVSYLIREVSLRLYIDPERRRRVLENRVLTSIFGTKRYEVTWEWRQLHNEELNDLYTSLRIFRVIKSKRMRWAGHVARMGERRGVCRVMVGKPEGDTTWKTQL